jgi:hypothetical protein
MHHPENIFSWRPELRSLTRQERTQWFYQQKLIPSLSADVQAAESARLDHHHDQVTDFFNTWTQEGLTKEFVVYDKALERAEVQPLENELEMIGVGLAGLGRILHVDMNSQLTSSTSFIELISNQQKQRLVRLYQKLEVGSLPPKTIHGGPIHWGSELVLDETRGYEKIGMTEISLPLLFDTAHQLQEYLNRMTPFMGEHLRTSATGAESHQQYYAAMSGLSVVVARIGRILKQVNALGQAVDFNLQATEHTMNANRLATLSLWALQLAWSTKADGSATDRVFTTYLATKGLFKALVANPKQTLAAIKHSFL